MLNPKNIGSVTFLLIRKNQLPPTSVASRPREFSMNQFLKRFLFKLDSPRLVSRPFFPPPPLSIHGQTGKFSLKYSSGSTRSCRGFFVLDIIKPASFLLSSPSCPSREDVDNASTSQIDAKPRNCWTLDRTELNDERERERERSSVSCFIRFCAPVPCQSKEFFVVGRRFITVHTINHLTDRSNEIYRPCIDVFLATIWNWTRISGK